MEITHQRCSRETCKHEGREQPLSCFSLSLGKHRKYCKTCQNEEGARYRRAKGLPTREEMAEDQTDCPLPAPPDLTVQLLHLHTKRAYGAQPMRASW
jgi:hypothetical protein